MKSPNILIVGGGLSGLMIAYLLKKKGIEATILEASDRIGGRIETLIGTSTVTIEMGATWFGNQHPHLLALLKELEIPYFKQHTKGVSFFETMSFVPPQKFEISDADEPSFRIAGGTSRLLSKLIDSIGLQCIKTKTRVVSIKDVGEQLAVKDSNGNLFLADKVITTLPPHLLIKTITFDPSLPDTFITVAKKTHTWMGESIKFAVEYETAFWRENNFSGTLYSQASIIQEMYDHSTFDSSGFALKGFLNGGTHAMSSTEREEKVIQQLCSVFGPEAKKYIAYHEKIWRNEPLAFYPYEELVMAHQNNGHPQYKKTLFNNKLYLSGSETATINPGYMDGAVVAASYIAAQF
jgi:monoamine oxidase